MPTVSVLMAVYNGEQYLREALDSILNQTFTDFEFIIVNDSSTDETTQILRAYAKQDSRLTLIENDTNIGLTKSLNIGLKQAKGNYIARMDADDISLPYRLAQQVSILDTQPKIIIASGEIDIINEQGQIIGHQRRAAPPAIVAWRMFFYNYLGGHAQIMFRRQPALELGGYSENRRFSQDYELWLRLMSRGKIIISPKVWLRLRRHKKNISHQYFTEQEKLSLTDSCQYIKKILGHQLTLSELATLRSFWLEPFPTSNSAPFVHQQLKQLSQAFIKLHPQQKNLIQQDIGKQFISWTRSVSLQRHPWQKLRLAMYALKWHPQGLIIELKKIKGAKFA